MIKLMPIVEQIQQDQLEEAGVKDFALGAAMVASSIFGGAKAQSKIPTDKPAITINDTRTGTDVDGINGFFTSQFEFPTSFLKDLNKKTITNLGYEGNNALQKVNKSGVTVKQMEEWNNFAKWMKSKGFSGNKQMNHVEFSNDVLEQYKQEKSGFWVKDSNDIKKIQTVIKGYRDYTIGIWKLGFKGALKAGFNPIQIMDLEPTPENIKRVENNYMPWAK